MPALSETVVVRIPKDVHVALTAMALGEGVAVSKVVRRLIDEALAREAEPPEPLPLPVASPVQVTVPGPVPISSLPPPGGGEAALARVEVEGLSRGAIRLDDPVTAEVVKDAPKHWHRREAVSTSWVNGQKVTTYRCKDCGAPLT